MLVQWGSDYTTQHPVQKKKELEMAGKEREKNEGWSKVVRREGGERVTKKT